MTFYEFIFSWATKKSNSKINGSRSEVEGFNQYKTGKISVSFPLNTKKLP